ncbi:oxygenase [Lithospermum erythrorhizon]|uniref:Oxygenase n=1 Tax=Lithospermum erythrorhizon TaxID=34254 RepID=A0AAV3NVQ8_LITER
MLSYMQSILIFLPPSCIFLYFLYTKFSHPSSTPPQNQPPSPPRRPIIGNLHQLGASPHRALQSLSNRHGPVMLMHLGRVETLIISSANAAREAMKTHDLVFSSRPFQSITHKLLYGSKDIAFTPYGEYWRKVRSIGVLHLMSSHRVQLCRNVREEETSLLVQKIAQSCSSGPINLTDLFVLLMSDVICRVALGRKYSEEENWKSLEALLRDFMNLLGAYNIGDYIPWLAWMNKFNGLDARVEKVVKNMDDFLEVVVKEHKISKKFETENGLDFVDILLKIQRETDPTVDDETIKALILDMFSAGTDTAHTVLEWAMSELIKNPKKMERLQIEVRKFAKGNTECINEDDLTKMGYLKAVIKETLRLHAPVPLLIPRETTQDVKFMGYDIKSGTRVLVNAWAIGRDESLWDNAEDFEPERFVDDNNNNNNSIDFKGFDFELIPFGAGRRGCPGMSFAIAITELALAKLVHKFDFSLPDGLRGEDLDMTEAVAIIVHKSSPLIVDAITYNG